MKVLGLASYPIEAAATRYRLEQFVAPLADRGITLTIRPFLDSKLFAELYQRDRAARKVIALMKSALLRLKDLLRVSQAEVVLVQREAMLFGPPWFEWMVVKVFKRPIVLDLDDATYVPYTSPTYGTLGKALKWFRKTDDLIRWASVVTCGNRAIAEYAKSKGAKAQIIPTVVDTEVFRPGRRVNDVMVLGWIGTHSTFPYLEGIFPVLQDLAGTHRFKLRIVGSGRESVAVPGVEIENVEWRLDREVKDFQSFDIGLYPIDPGLYAKDWAAGKSGFKAIQYMAVGIPFVASPVGALTEIGEAEVTHLLAIRQDEWRDSLKLLMSDAQLRERMGAAGRRHVVQHFSLSDQADKLAQALHQAKADREVD